METYVILILSVVLVQLLGSNGISFSVIPIQGSIFEADFPDQTDKRNRRRCPLSTAV